MDLADRSLDHYLPSDEESDSPSRGSPEAPLVPVRRREDIQPAVVANHAVRLTAKVRRRMYSRAMKDLRQLKLRSDEAVKKMTHSVDLVSLDFNCFSFYKKELSLRDYFKAN